MTSKISRSLHLTGWMLIVLNRIGAMVVITTSASKSIGSNYSGVVNQARGFKQGGTGNRPYIYMHGTSMPAGTWRCMSLMMYYQWTGNYFPNQYSYQYLYVRVA